MPPGDGFLEDISTHNLTRRLTDYLLEGDILLCISTHSLTRRLTVISILLENSFTFQLTASQGG